jgi:hypothetical protein
MTTDNEDTIREIISNAKTIQDLLKELLQRAESDPGAPFESEMIELIAELRRHEPAEYFRLRQKLKKHGVLVRELDAATSGRSDVATGGVGTGSVQTEILLRMAEEAELFHTPDGRAYADILVNGGRRTLEISEGGFSDWLRSRWFKETRNAPCPEALRSAIRTLAAAAQQEGPQYEVHIRVAEHEGSYYLDLANDAGYVVKFNSDGWQVVRSAPVRFVQPRGLMALPVPEKGGSLERQLFPLLNLRDQSQRVLVTFWLVNCLIASSNYRVLVLQGEQGSAKSRTTRTLRNLLDPNVVPLRAPPRNERELVISAINGHLLAFDNVSSLKQEMSDALCRLATGTGLAPRRLWTGREEELLTAVKPIILNGIEQFVTRGDLADRAIAITLQAITSELYRTNAELDEAFKQTWPQILGALLDVAVHGLARIDRLETKPLSRMADFDRMATACETALWPAGTYKRAFAENRGELVDAGIEADLLATAVVKMVSEAAMRAVRAVETVRSNIQLWKGTATSLLQELDNRNSALMRSREWPKNPRQLAGRLRRAGPLLRHKGIEIEFREEGHSNTRMIYFTAYPSFFGEQVAPLAPLADGPPRVDASVAEQDAVDEDGNVIQTPPPGSAAPGTNTADALISNGPEIKRYVTIRKPQGFRRSGA